METAGKVAEARAALEKAVTFAARASAIGSADRHTDYDRAVTEYILANMLLNMKDIPGSLTHAQNALTITEQLKKADPANRKWRRADELALSSMGIVHRDLSGSDPALRAKSIDYLQSSLAEATELMREDPKDARGKDDVIVVCHRLARSLAEDGRWDDAAQLYDQAGQAAHELLALNPRNRRHWYLLAANQINYGQMRMDQGRIEEGKRLLLSADPFFERGLALDPFDATILDLRATQFEKLAEIADRVGDRKTAQDRVRRCLAVINAMVQRDPAAKDYIGDYTEILALARRLGVPTGDLH
jgi:tetratricopeptide (TPR) repeat protein